MKSNQFRIMYFLSTIAVALLNEAVHADDDPGVVTKVENAVERGAQAAASGVEHAAKVTKHGIAKGAKATERGVKRGVDATTNGVKRAARATQETADHVADKISQPSESSHK